MKKEVFSIHSSFSEINYRIGGVLCVLYYEESIEKFTIEPCDYDHTISSTFVNVPMCLLIDRQVYHVKLKYNEKTEEITFIY